MRHLVTYYAVVFLLALYAALEICLFQATAGYYASHYLSDPSRWYAPWLWYHMIDLKLRFSALFTAPVIALLYLFKRGIYGHRV